MATTTRRSTVPSGKKARGGGSSTNSTNGKLVTNAPTNSGTGWIAGYDNLGNSTITIYACVICANVSW